MECVVSARIIDRRIFVGLLSRHMSIGSFILISLAWPNDISSESLAVTEEGVTVQRAIYRAARASKRHPGVGYRRKRKADPEPDFARESDLSDRGFLKEEIARVRMMTSSMRMVRPCSCCGCDQARSRCSRGMEGDPPFKLPKFQM